MSPVHQMDELDVIHGIDQMHRRQIAEQRLHGPPHLGVRMHRKHELQVGEPLGQIANRRAHRPQRRPEALRRWVVNRTRRRLGSSPASPGVLN